MSRQGEIKELIKIHNDRLQELKKRQAFQGVHHVDPAITLEIKKIEAEIEDLQVEIQQVETDKDPEMMATAQKLIDNEQSTATNNTINISGGTVQGIVQENKGRLSINIGGSSSED